MATKTETIRTGEFIQSEARGERSRDEITVKSGQNLSAGDVLAREATGLTAASAADAGNTGDGTMGTVTPAVTAKEGQYIVTIVEPATDAGAFTVEDPDGENVGTGTVAVAFSSDIGFTLADGATDFVAGDRFIITISQGTGLYKALPNDGTEEAAGVLYADVDASAAAVQGVGIVRDAEVNGLLITWPSGISDTNKDLAIGQFAALGIIVR